MQLHLLGYGCADMRVQVHLTGSAAAGKPRLPPPTHPLSHMRAITSRSVIRGVFTVLIGACGIWMFAGLREFGRARWSDRGEWHPNAGQKAGQVFSTLRADGPLSPPKDVVLLLMNSHCSVCSHNMNNWVSLIHDIREASPASVILGGGVESLDLQHAYWSALRGSVLPVQVNDIRGLVTLMGADAVPSVVIVHNGMVRATFAGYLGPTRRQRVLRIIKGGVS